jgi:hypothetical protein
VVVVAATVVVVGATVVVVVGAGLVVVVVGAAVEVTRGMLVVGAGVVTVVGVAAADVFVGANVAVGAGIVVLVDRVAFVPGRRVRVVVVARMVVDDVAELDGACVTSTPSTLTPTAEVEGTEPTFPTFTVSGGWGRSATRPITTAASSATASNTSARCRGSGVSRTGTAPIVAVATPEGADSAPWSLSGGCSPQPTGSSTRSV